MCVWRDTTTGGPLSLCGVSSSLCYTGPLVPIFCAEVLFNRLSGHSWGDGSSFLSSAVVAGPPPTYGTSLSTGVSFRRSSVTVSYSGVSPSGRVGTPVTISSRPGRQGDGTSRRIHTKVSRVKLLSAVSRLYGPNPRHGGPVVTPLFPMYSLYRH